MVNINSPIPPEDLSPNPLAAIAGNHADDDGSALDEYFEPNPDLVGLPYGGPVASETAYEAESLPKIQRILSRSIPIGTIDGNIADPVQVFPADGNRHSLRIVITGDVEVHIGSDKTDVYGGAVVSGYATGPTEYVFDRYTGALWVYSTEAAPVTVNVFSVTE